MSNIKEGIKYHEEELEDARKHLHALTENCRKMLPKFPEKSPQHTLLLNRIRALEVSYEFLSDPARNCSEPKESMESILEPLASIIRKSEKALEKAKPHSPHAKRLERLIKTITISMEHLNLRKNRMIK